MSLKPLIAKLTTLKFPGLNQLKNQSELSFLNFGKIVQHLENQYIRQSDDAERRQLEPIGHDGDVKQYANNLQVYLSREELGAPQIFISLAQRIIPAPVVCTPQLILADGSDPGNKKDTKSAPNQSPSKDSIARLQLATFLVAKAVEFDHQELIVNREKQQTQTTDKNDATKANVDQNATTKSILAPHNLVAQPSGGASLNSAGFIKVFGDIVPSTFDLTKFNATVANPAFEKAEKSIFTTILSTKASASTPQQANLITKEIDRMTQSMTKPGNLNKHLALSFDLFATVPVAGSIKSLFDIDLGAENDMLLWEYIMYVATVYSYVGRMTDKIGLHFALPKVLHGIALALTGLQKGCYPVPPASPEDQAKVNKNQQDTDMKDAEGADKNQNGQNDQNDQTGPSDPKGKKDTKKSLVKKTHPTSTTAPSLTQVSETADQLWVLAKATHMMVLSVFREFSRRVECEVTSTALALKSFRPTSKSTFSEPLLNYLEEIAPKGLVDLEKEREKIKGRKEAEDIIMPSHIFPSASANPNALKKAAKEFLNEKKAAAAGKKSPKGGQETTEEAAVVEPASTVISGANMPVADVKKADLKKIKQQRLKKESFAVRNAGITDYVNSRFHLSRLVSISSLTSQEALFKLSTLATLPLGAEATKRQQEQLAAFGKASLEKQGTTSTTTTTTAAPTTAPTTTSAPNTKTSNLVSSQHFVSILTTLIQLMYDQQLQQQQNIITRWIQYLQTFTARQSHQGSSK